LAVGGYVPSRTFFARGTVVKLRLGPQHSKALTR
jgi:hypothetical protein